MQKSIEEKVEEYYKKKLDDLGVKHYGKTQSINPAIRKALDMAPSKSGKTGHNYPDIQIILNDGNARTIPVMIEAKGSKGKLEKIKNGEIVQITEYENNSKINSKKPHKKGDLNYTNIKKYAVNGALHYGLSILKNSDYSEVIIIGVNATSLTYDNTVYNPESKVYYISKKNKFVPKLIPEISDDWSLFKESNIPKLFKKIDKLNLTDEELSALTLNTENKLEKKVKNIHQKIYDNSNIKNLLTTNEKLYVFTGLIMAGLHTKGVLKLSPSDLNGQRSSNINDGQIVLDHIEAFLNSLHDEKSTINMVLRLLRPVFQNKSLWFPTNGQSLLNDIYNDIYNDIIPLIESNLHLDFTGKILNSLTDWVSIPNDNYNDVVLTPRYVTSLMAKLTHTNKDSFVWDTAMGSAGFLVSSMDLMIKDAINSLHDEKELKDKIKNIKTNQLLGIESLGNIYILAILNMILMGDGSSNMIREDSHKIFNEIEFPANVFLLNPPYSAPGHGLNFVEEAFSKMKDGYGAVLIKENAGSGDGNPYAKNILKHNELLASIKMPNDLFSGKASVQTAIYVFKVNHPHNAKRAVTFIDFSEDGYLRQSRKKSSQDVNLRDIDNAKLRYQEVVDIVLENVPDTHYYTQENNKVINTKISLNGDDWTFNQHTKINTIPNEKDFETTVANYLSWKVKKLLMRGISND